MQRRAPAKDVDAFTYGTGDSAVVLGAPLMVRQGSRKQSDQGLLVQLGVRAISQKAAKLQTNFQAQQRSAASATPEQFSSVIARYGLENEAPSLFGPRGWRFERDVLQAVGEEMFDNLRAARGRSPETLYQRAFVMDFCQGPAADLGHELFDAQRKAQMLLIAQSLGLVLIPGTVQRPFLPLPLESLQHEPIQEIYQEQASDMMARLHLDG